MITEPQPVIEQLADGTPLGRYVIRTWVRDGGGATVYRGHHVETQAPVAIKVMTHAASRDTTAQARFSRETALLGRLAGVAHVAMVHDVGGLPDGRRYIVMEWVDGEDLSDVLQRLRDNGRRMAPLRACRIARDVARALVVAHARGIVHRDIKPANIMLDGTGPLEVAKVLDFGVSADLQPHALPQNLTQGAAVGTDIYMSPEQSLGQPPSPAMDVWAVGAVLLEMLRGARPGLELRHGAFPPFPQPAPFPPDTLPLVQACVSVDPEHRPEIPAVLQRLERLVSELERESLEARGPETPASWAPPAAAPEGATPAGPAITPATPSPSSPSPSPRGMAASGVIECAREPLQLGPSPTQLESPRPPRRWEWPIEQEAVSRMPARDVTVPTPAAGPTYVGVPASMTVGPWATTPMAAPRTAPVGGGSTMPPVASPPRGMPSAIEDPTEERSSVGRWIGLSLAFVTLGLGLAAVGVWAQHGFDEDIGPLAASAGPARVESPDAPTTTPIEKTPVDAPVEVAPPAVAPPAVAPAAPPATAPKEPPSGSSRGTALARADERPGNANVSGRESATRAPAPKPVKSPKPTPAQPDVDCKDVLAKAKQAHLDRNWGRVLTATTTRSCWSQSPVDRILLRVTALLELGRFDTCVREAGDYTDDRVKKRVEICRQRLAKP